MALHTGLFNPLRLRLVRVENAARSQIAAALAEIQTLIQDRGEIKIVSDGTDRINTIHQT